MKPRLLTFRFSLLLVALLATAFMIGCKSSKKTAKAPKGEEKVTLYCSGKEYFSDDKFFRANDVGESTNQSMAKRKALSNARLQLAASIETTVKAVIDNYFNSYTSGKTIEDRERYEGLSREVINQRLAGVRTICEEFTRTPDGNYKCYVAIELSGEDLANSIAKRISEDEKLRIDFQYENFKKTFEQEMEKFKKERM